MRIACPNCSAEYDVPDSLLAAGPRMLRCARCKEQFEAAMPAAVPGAEPPPATPDAPPAAMPAPEPAPRPDPAPPPPEVTGPPEAEAPPPADRDRPAPTRGPARHSPIEPPVLQHNPETEAGRSGTPVAVAWLLSLALIVAAGWATYTFHAEITAAWPPAARLYQALGIN